MKKLLIVLLVLAAWSSAKATTIAVIVENNTSRATIGVDTLLGDAMTSVLGYTVHYRDIDTIQTSAYWLANYQGAVLVGSEVTAPSPTANCDSITKVIPTLAIDPNYFDEINLGTATGNTTENAGYLINLGQNHWITKVLQDTVIFWAVSAASVYGLTIPDSLHSVQVLLLDKDNRSDTSRASLAVAEQGTTVINTSGGVPGPVAQARRVFFGLWQYQAQTPDSCQFWTTFLRSVAWVVGDTNNVGIDRRVCFSGKYEIDQSCVVENSSGTDSIECYGVWDDLYTGYDYNYKRHYLKPRGIAVQRKLANIYRSVTVSQARIRLRFETTAWDVTPPATYNSNWSYAPILRYWNGGNRGGAVHSSSVPYACWTYRYGADVNGTFTSYPWATGGAQSDGVDMSATYIDSIVVTQDSVGNRYHYVDVDTASLNSRILDSTLFQGWVANTLSASNTGPGGEVVYYSVTTGVTAYRPQIGILFSSSSTTDPMPSIAFLYDSLAVASTVGTNPSTDLYNHNNLVSNSSGGALACVSVSDDAAWLTTTVTGNYQTQFGITAVIDVTGLAAGYYSALVTVQCDDADNSPATYKVALTLTAGTPPASVPKVSGYTR